MHRASTWLWTLVLVGLPTAARGDREVPAIEVQIELSEEADVPARESGVLAAISASEGTRVNQGDVLAQVEDQDAQLLLETARLEEIIATKEAENEVAVETAEKVHEVAQKVYERAKESDERSRTVSQMELDRIRLDAEKAMLAIQQAKHELAVAQMTLSLKRAEHRLAEYAAERKKVLAPFDGVVIEVARNAGEWVKPGDKVLRLVRLDPLRAEGFATADAFSGDLVGAAVTITVTSQGRPSSRFSGKLIFVSPEVDPVNHQVRVLAEIENPDFALRPGLRAQMTIGAPQTSARRESPGSSRVIRNPMLTAAHEFARLQARKNLD